MSILQIVRDESNSMPKPSDPREQEVFSLPRPLVIDPIFVQALKGELQAGDTCVGCGEKVYMHYDTSGCFFISCEGAIRRRELGLMQNHAVMGVDLNVGDQHPLIARHLRNLLLVGFGAVSAVYGELQHDDQWLIARTLANRAVRMYLEEQKDGE